jgi:hypothetical protein
LTSGHFIYIPMVLAVGTILGFILGGRAARDAIAAQQKRDEERAAAKAARLEAKAKKAQPAGSDAPTPDAKP